MIEITYKDNIKKKWFLIHFNKKKNYFTNLMYIIIFGSQTIKKLKIISWISRLLYSLVLQFFLIFSNIRKTMDIFFLNNLCKYQKYNISD